MFDSALLPGPRPDANWVLIDDLASLEPYVEIFNLGKLVPLTDKFVPFTEEEKATRGMLSLIAQRQEEVMTLPRNNKEQTTYYTVLDEKAWATMKHELTKPKRTPHPNPRRNWSNSVQERVEWFDTFLRENQLPTAFTFVMTNSAIIGDNVFWPLRVSHNGKWAELIAENVPPTHQFKRRT
jgi:hypothetical protein